MLLNSGEEVIWLPWWRGIRRPSRLSVALWETWSARALEPLSVRLFGERYLCCFDQRQIEHCLSLSLPPDEEQLCSPSARRRFAPLCGTRDGEELLRDAERHLSAALPTLFKTFQRCAAVTVSEWLEARTSRPISLPDIARSISERGLALELFKLDISRDTEPAIALRQLLSTLDARVNSAPAIGPLPAPRALRRLIAKVLRRLPSAERSEGAAAKLALFLALREQLCQLLSALIVALDEEHGWGARWLPRLRQEWRKGEEQGSGAGALDELDELPESRAFVYELLRLLPLQPFCVSPLSGPVEEELSPRLRFGLFSPLVLHRSPELWIDAERFEPARFLSPLSAAQRALFRPFGVGSVDQRSPLLTLTLGILTALYRRGRLQRTEPLRSTQDEIFHLDQLPRGRLSFFDGKEGVQLRYQTWEDLYYLPSERVSL